MRVLLIALVIWSATGLAISYLYRRQGHNLLVYAGLAIWMGPLIFFIMRSVAREQQSPVEVFRSGQPRDGGWLDVLVGIDGSNESVQSVLQVLNRLEPALRRVRIVSSLDPETANSRNHFDTDEEIQTRLELVAKTFGPDSTELAFISGRADKSLVHHAAKEGFDFLVVAHRHHRVLGSLLGSTVQRLTRSATVPIIVGPPAAPEFQHHPTRMALLGTEQPLQLMKRADQ